MILIYWWKVLWNPIFPFLSEFNRNFLLIFLVSAKAFKKKNLSGGFLTQSTSLGADNQPESSLEPPESILGQEATYR